jgi:hypothetical protein
MVYLNFMTKQSTLDTVNLTGQSGRNSLLPPGVPSEGYRNFLSLKNVKEWEAKIILGNSIATSTDSKDKIKEIGDWDDVGYVMVSIVGPVNFIPIAISDEHHCGADLMYEMAEKWKINPAHYMPIAPKSTVGIYLFRADVTSELEACRRWLAAGGPSFVVKSIKDNRGVNWTTDCEDFIAQNGKVSFMKSGLLKPGHQLINAFGRLYNILNASRIQGSQGSMTTQYRDSCLKAIPPVLDSIERLLITYFDFGSESISGFREDKNDILPEKVMNSIKNNKLFLEDRIKIIRAFCDDSLAMGNVTAVEAVMFSHHGIKNSIHRAIRDDLQGVGLGRVNHPTLKSGGF